MSNIINKDEVAEAIIKINRANRKVQSPFQEALRLYMSVRGVTARGLGASLQIDHTAISRFVNGSDISQENYTKLLAWFIQKPSYPPSTEDEQVQAKS